MIPPPPGPQSPIGDLWSRPGSLDAPHVLVTARLSFRLLLFATGLAAGARIAVALGGG